MSYGILPNGKQQFIDSNGNPLAGGKVYYYIPSTTTFKNTYQDDAGSSLNTNPVVLDASGQCIAYGTGSYRQQVFDVNNNLIWDQQVDTPLTSLSVISAANVLYQYPASGAVSESVQTKLQESISVKDFGAVGDGTTDDTAAIQAALTYCGSTKTLFIPFGTYKITDSLVFVDYQCVRGDGWRITKITGNLPNKSLIRTQYGETPTYAQRTIGWDIAGFQVDAQSAAGSIGLNYGNVGYCNLSDVGIYNAPIGLQCTQRTYYAMFINLTIQACNICAYLQSDGGANEFLNPNFGFQSAGGCGVKIISGSWKFSDGTIDTNSTNSDSFFSVGQNGYATTASIQVFNMYVEGVDSSVKLFHFYDNVVTSNIYGVERRGALGANVFENTTIYSGIYIDSQSMMNPQGPFARQSVFGRDPGTQVIDGGIKSLEGNTLQILNQALTSPGNLSLQNLFVGGNGSTSSGIYFSSVAPEGVVTAAAGSLCIVNTGGGTGNTGGTYKKTGGAGNTGWVAL